MATVIIKREEWSIERDRVMTTEQNTIRATCKPRRDVAGETKFTKNLLGLLGSRIARKQILVVESLICAILYDIQQTNTQPQIPERS